jgi:hypothetical protein
VTLQERSVKEGGASHGKEFRFMGRYRRSIDDGVQ